MSGRLLYDLAGADGRRFSPFCWRAKMALLHKGLPFDTRPTRFMDISKIAGGGHKTVPVLDDRGHVVRDSFEIALYLERAYPDRPSLFGGEGGQAAARFTDAWVGSAISPALIGLVVHDIHECLDDGDKPYFRESREKRLGLALEEAQASRETKVAVLRDALLPLRRMLSFQPFIGGATPLFSDYILFGTLQWSRVISTFSILEPDDPVAEWFERMLDLHAGAGRNQRAA